MAEAGVQTTASSMQETSPSWRLHVPRGASALDFTPSPAKHCHRVAPRPQVLRAWERQAQPTKAAVRVLPPNPDI